MTTLKPSNVLLFFPSHVEPHASASAAVSATHARGGRLIVVATLDPERVDRVSRKLIDGAFLGDKVSDDLGATLERESRHQAETLAASVVAQAQREGVDAEARVERGDPTEICARIARAEGVELVFVAAERQSWLTRLLSGGAVRLPELPECEVRVIEEAD